MRRGERYFHGLSVEYDVSTDRMRMLEDDQQQDCEGTLDKYLWNMYPYHANNSDDDE